MEMKKVDSTINNQTAYSVNLEIRDLEQNKTASISLKPMEEFRLRVFDCEHEIKLVKFNEKHENKIFLGKISSFMSICQEFSTNEVYFFDSVNNLKHKATENSNSSDFLLVSAGAPAGNSYSSSNYKYGNNNNTQPGSYSQSTASYGASGAPTSNYSSSSGSYSTSYPSSYGASVPANYGSNYAASYTTSLPGNYTTSMPSSYGTTSFPANYNTSLPSSYGTSSVTGGGYTTNVPVNGYGTTSGSYSNNFPINGYTTNNVPGSSYNAGSYSYNFPSMNFDSLKVDMPNLNNAQSFTKDLSFPSTNYTSSTTFVNPASTYNFNTTSYNFPTTTATTTNLNNYTPITTTTTINNNNANSAFINVDQFKNFEIPSPQKTTLTLQKKASLNVFNNMNLKKFGSFMIDQNQFEVNFIKEDIVKNRLNIFNQLHKHNLKDEEKKAMDYADADQIKIKNKSTNSFFVRLSGGQGKDLTEYLNEGETRTFKRQELSIFKVNITTSISLAGITYNVKTGCKYVIDESNNLTDPGKNTLISTSKPYNPNFAAFGQFGIFYKKDDQTFFAGLERDPSLIIVVNRGNDSVSVKVEGDSPSNFEDYIEIEPLVYAVFKRKQATSYVLTYNKRGLSETVKHIVAAGNAYCFAEEALGLCEDSSKRSLEIFHPQENIAKEELNVYWEKMKQLVKNNPNKHKLKSFDTLLFGKIEVKNNSGFEVYIRIMSRKIGSEEFAELKRAESRSWKRFDGTYLTELVALHDLRSKRFLLRTDINYTVNEYLEIIDPNTNLPLAREADTFATKQLVFYDSTQRQYLRRDIVYENEKEMKIQESEEKRLEQEEEKKDFEEQGHKDDCPEWGEFEYFEEIKPDYEVGEPFLDAHFPPDETSLEAVDPFTHLKRKPHFVHAKQSLSATSIKNLTFKRPRDAFKGQYYLFKDEICYDDVKQGQIGNCYLMSILAALSQRPDLIKAVFKTQTVNPDGYYELFYFENGKQKVIFIDDNVVMQKSAFMPDFQFAKPNGEELWVMLIEKAYAKYEGGYSNILGGLMYPELRWLTGALTREIRTTDPQCWNEIYNAAKARHILVTGSLTGSGNHNKKSLKGISNGHAYSILDAKEYRAPGSNSSLRLLKMRNPWGNGEWTGDYCDDSQLWTPQLKVFYGFSEAAAKNDGVFFMPYDDYINEFKNVVICAIDTKN